MLDFGIERLEGLQYYHWLMANEFGFGIIDQFVVMAELSQQLSHSKFVFCRCMLQECVKLNHGYFLKNCKISSAVHDISF